MFLVCNTRFFGLHKTVRGDESDNLQDSESRFDGKQKPNVLAMRIKNIGWEKLERPLRDQFDDRFIRKVWNLLDKELWDDIAVENVLLVLLESLKEYRFETRKHR